MLSGVIALVGVLVVATSAHAAGFVIGNDNGDALVRANQTVDSTAFLAGNKVIVDGIIKGDLYCAGEDVVITGTVEGDVLCAGANVTVNGVVQGDVRVAGSDVKLGGEVQGSVTAGGSTVTTTPSFKVARDFTGGGETTDLSGLFGRDVHVGGTNVILNGDITRDLSLQAEEITVGKSTAVMGNVWYKSPKEVVDNNAFAGKVHHEPMTTDESSFDIGGILIGILSLIVLAVVATLVMPRFIHVAASLPTRDVLLAFLIGFVAIILVPLLAVIFFATFVGWIVGIVLLLAWVLALVTSTVFASYYIGTLALQKRATNALLVALVGSAILSVLMLIPFINVLVVIVAVCAGVGMQIMHIKYQFSKDPYTITA
jgi:hypothetical protein